MVFFKKTIKYLQKGLQATRQEGIKAVIQALKIRFQARLQGKKNFLLIKKWLLYYERRTEITQPLNNIDDNRFPKVSIIILTFNNLTISQLCLRSIYCNTTYPNFEIIVVDNASIDDTPAWLKTYSKTHPNLKLILNQDNLGFAAGNNQAARIAIGEYLIFLNNDTVVTKEWIERLLAHFKSDQKSGLIGPVTNATGNEARVPVDYSTPEKMEAFAARRARTMAMQSFDIRMLAFYCVMTRKEQYEALGGLDERFSVGMFEDDDFAVRCHQAGLRVICAEDIFIHHFQGFSFGKLANEKYQKIFEENRKKYEEKWGHEWQPYKLRNFSLTDAKQANECVVTNWGPRFTEQNTPFNVQPNGESAIWIEATGIKSSLEIKVLFDGKPMENTCVHSQGINAVVPLSYLTDMGAKKIVIKDDCSGRITFVGEFNIIPEEKLSQKSLTLSLVDLITSYYAARNFLFDIKQFPNSIAQGQLRLFEQGVGNLELLISNFIPNLNSFLLSSEALARLLENINSDPVECKQWLGFRNQVERLKIITVKITRELYSHVNSHKSIQIAIDSREEMLKHKGESFESLKRHNLELLYLEALAGETMPFSTPSHILLDVSNRCNYRCRTCFQSFSQNFVYNDLPEAAIKNLQSFLPYCYSANIAGAGEPLLSRSTPFLIRKLGAYGVRTDLVTNGSLLSRLRGIEHNVDHICVSMDGASAETVDVIRRGARFNQIIADIKKLPLNIRYKIIFNMVVGRANVHEIHKLVKLAKKIKISGVGLQEFSAYLPWHGPMKLRTEDYPLLMQQIRASHQELKGQNITSFIVACTVGDEGNQKVTKPDYKQILKLFNQVQTQVDSIRPQPWDNLALEFQDAAMLKIPKILLNHLSIVCNNSKDADLMKKSDGSHDAEICSRRDNLLQQLKAQPFIRFPHCLAPYTLINVHSDGTVKPCCILDRRCGSLTTDSSQSVWLSPAYVRLRQSFVTGIDLPDECIGCKDGVRFGQADKLLTKARSMGIDISKIVMPTDGCGPNKITELLINPDFASREAWNLPNAVDYDAENCIISAGVEAPVTQCVRVIPGSHYLYSIVARAAKKKVRARKHIKWLDKDGKFIATDMQ
ncbi:MAG: glycosyltransferase, partial [Candidatus Omnitrophota bacterium]